MRATLSKMGFGSSFIRWVDLFYTGVQSAVIVNGYLSGFFSLSRGVRQGCPLSPLLYVLVSEVLAVNIRANPAITGLSLPRVPAPLSPITLYADDTSLIVGSDSSIRAVFHTSYVQVCMQMRKLRFLRKIAKIVNCAKNPQLGLAILAKIAIFAIFRKNR